MKSLSRRSLLQLAGAAGVALLLPPAAVAAEPQYLVAITAGSDGTIFLADRQLPGIWKLSDGKLSILFAGSKKFRTPLNAVRCLAIDQNGKLLAGDSSTREVYRFGEDGQPLPLTKGGIGIPTAIAVRKSGELIVADLELHRIWAVPADGGEPKMFAEVNAPRGLAIDAQDNVWALSLGPTPLVRSSAEGKLDPVLKERTFEFPGDLALDNAGNAYVCDTYAKAVWKVIPGKPPTKWATGDPLVSPTGIVWQHDHLLVVDPRAKAIIRVDAEGKMSKIEFAIAQQ